MPFCLKRIFSFSFCLWLFASIARPALAAEPTWQDTLRAESKTLSIFMLPSYSLGIVHYTVPESVGEILENQKPEELLAFFKQLASETSNQSEKMAGPWVDIVQNRLKGTPGIVYTKTTDADGNVTKRGEIPVRHYTYHYGRSKQP
jgi:hypothetical protein